MGRTKMPIKPLAPDSKNIEKKKNCRVNGICQKLKDLSVLCGWKFDLMIQVKDQNYKYISNDENQGLEIIQKSIDGSSHKKLETFDKDCLVKEKPISIEMKKKKGII